MNDGTSESSWFLSAILGLHGFTLFAFVAVVTLTLMFLVGYLVKGTQVLRQLKGVGSELKKMSQGTAPRDVGPLFKEDPLRHIWSEYADTLHEVHGAAAGGVALTEWKATIPAEMMFTHEALVDARLFDEFTRHLPGVLTGLGIIGTFFGLIRGLKGFKPTPIESAVNGLGPLLLGVQHAFLASAIAIGCAMLVVFISRFALAYFYSLVDKLTREIDRLYSTGAGEEYLARLVKSSEQNSANTAQLKDALVEDLNKMMTNLVDRQIAAQDASIASLGQRIGDSIVDAMAEPMKRVSEAIEVTSRGNGEQVNTMLDTLLTGFMAKLEDTFGGQMRGINEQMQRSMGAMEAVQSSLQALLADIKQTNEHAANQMNGALEDVMKKAADNQQLLTDQMRDFVQDFRRLVTEEQSKSNQAMNETVMKVLSEVTTAVDSLEGVRKASAADEAGRNDKLANHTSQLVGGLAGQVETLLQTVSDQVGKTQRNIEALEQVSLRAIDGMNHGALTMGSAAQRFETAGNAVTTVFDRSTKVTETLSSASATLQAASTAVQRGFEQYDSTRKTVDTQVAALMGFIESAKKEAGVSRQLISDIEASVEKMRQSEAASLEHLSQVNDALVKAFTEFGTSLVGQVKSTIAETDRHLSQGTGHLNGVVQELAQAVQRMKRA